MIPHFCMPEYNCTAIKSSKKQTKKITFQIERLSEGEPGSYKVTGKMQNSEEEVTGEYNTVSSSYIC